MNSILDKHTLNFLWDYSKIYWLNGVTNLFTQNINFFSIIYSEYVNFLICIKHMKEGCSVGISSIEIHHKQQSSAKNTLNYVQKSMYAWTSWVLSCHFYVLLCTYTKQTLEIVTITAHKAYWMDLHWALVCPAVCLQKCTLLSHLKILPHIFEFSRSHKCDWFYYKIFLLSLSECWLCQYFDNHRLQCEK